MYVVNSVACRRLACVGSVLVNWNLSSNGMHTSHICSLYYQYIIQVCLIFTDRVDKRYSRDIFAPQDSYWYGICQLVRTTTAT